MKHFIQAGIGLAAQVQFEWPHGKPFDPDACPRCHDPILNIGERRWNVLGAERRGDCAYMLEHVCQGRMGKRSRARRVVEKHPALFDNRPGDDA